MVVRVWVVCTCCETIAFFVSEEKKRITQIFADTPRDTTFLVGSQIYAKWTTAKLPFQWYVSTLRLDAILLRFWWIVGPKYLTICAFG